MPTATENSCSANLKLELMESKLVLLEHFMSHLNDGQQQSVIDYANFLVQQSKELPASCEKALPKQIERPVKETMTVAIKRLKRTYFMLDTDDMLNDVSGLMGKHILQGLAASVAIDELQLCFQSYYQQYLNND